MNVLMICSHQKQALAFMRQRERGWLISEHGQDVWSEDAENHGSPLYVATFNMRLISKRT